MITVHRLCEYGITSMGCSALRLSSEVLEAPFPQEAAEAHGGPRFGQQARGFGPQIEGLWVVGEDLEAAQACEAV